MHKGKKMDLLWRILYIVIFSLFIFILHRKIGRYPPPLPNSDNPRREIREAFLLWGVAVVIPILRLLVITPWLSSLKFNRTLQELIYLPLLTILYLILPLYVERKRNKRTIKELGLRWDIQSPDVAIAAVSFGLLSGIVAYANNQAVISMNPLPAGALFLLLYNNDFLEEFFHRGVIQTKLERALGQTKALFLGGVLFGLTHLVFDIQMLIDTQGSLFVFTAFLLQVMSGWLLGIVFMKTRSLWPGIACHYLVNWLPSILAGLFR
jgi:membrane protease YdiL (CAAX protease family)